jgi:hypothetical protein
MASKRFLALLDLERDIHVAKSAGYAGQDNPDAWSNFREAAGWGLSPLDGCLVRMGDKYKRAQTIRSDTTNEQVGESLRDTLLDLANYALIAICLLDENTLGVEA